MAWEEFAQCLGGQADDLAVLASDGGTWLAETIAYLGATYAGLPEWARVAIGAAGANGRDALVQAASAFGLQIPEAIAGYLAANGIADGLARLVQCRERLLA